GVATASLSKRGNAPPFLGQALLKLEKRSRQNSQSHAAVPFFAVEKQASGGGGKRSRPRQFRCPPFRRTSQPDKLRARTSVSFASCQRGVPKPPYFTGSGSAVGGHALRDLQLFGLASRNR